MYAESSTAGLHRAPNRVHHVRESSYRPVASPCVPRFASLPCEVTYVRERFRSCFYGKRKDAESIRYTHKKTQIPFSIPAQTWLCHVTHERHGYTLSLASDRVTLESSGESVTRGELQTSPQKPGLRLKSGFGERLHGALAQWDAHEKT